jgi:hypothetical protein
MYKKIYKTDFYILANRTVCPVMLSSIFVIVVVNIICIYNILSLLMFIYVPEKTS